MRHYKMSVCGCESLGGWALSPLPGANSLPVGFVCREGSAPGSYPGRLTIRKSSSLWGKKIPYNIRESDAFNSSSRKIGGRLEQAIKGKVLKIGSSPRAEWEEFWSQPPGLPATGHAPPGWNMGSPSVSTAGFPLRVCKTRGFGWNSFLSGRPARRSVRLRTCAPALTLGSGSKGALSPDALQGPGNTLGSGPGEVCELGLFTKPSFFPYKKGTIAASLSFLELIGGPKVNCKGRCPSCLLLLWCIAFSIRVLLWEGRESRKVLLWCCQ